MEDDCLVIIPTKNEEKNLKKNIKKLIDLKVNFLHVLDYCEDKSEEIINEFNTQYINNNLDPGYDSAIYLGIKYAKSNNYKSILTFDADNQLPFDQIKSFIALQKDYELIIGNRNKKRLSERFAALIFNLKYKIKDPFCGMKLINIKSLDMKKIKGKKLIGIQLLFNLNKNRIKNINIVVKTTNRVSRFGNVIDANIKILLSLFKFYYAKI